MDLSNFLLLHEKYPNRKYVAIITDLSKFKAYSSFIERKAINIVEISSMNVENTPPNEIILWIDSFFFSQKGTPPSARDLNITFGIKSPHFVLIQKELFREFWKNAYIQSLYYSVILCTTLSSGIFIKGRRYQ